MEQLGQQQLSQFLSPADS